MGKHNNVFSSSSSSGSDNDEALRAMSSKAKKAKFEGGGDATLQEELFEDEEDMDRLNKMSEKEREIEIFKRIEKRELLKTREQIKKKLEIAEKRSKKGEAIGGKRKQREAAKKATEKVVRKPVDDSDDEEESGAEEAGKNQQAEGKGAFTSSSSPASSPASSDEGTSGKKATKKKKEKKAALRKKQSGGESGSEEEEEEYDLDYHRPSEVANKQRKKQAMDNLMKKRQSKKEAEERKKQRAPLDIDEIFGDDGEKSSSSSSDSQSDSSARSSSTDSSDDDGEGGEKVVHVSIDSRADLLKCRLSRFKLAKFVYAPFFADLVKGCYVRIGIGNREGQPVYRVAEIVAVVETPKVYDVENTRTNKGIRLRVGTEEKVWRLEYISNQEFTEQEFQYWLKNMNERQIQLPSKQFAEAKEKRIQEASNYKYTDKEIDQMVKEKARFSKAPQNYVQEKFKLKHMKEVALQRDDIEQASEIQAQIDELDSQTGKLEQARSKRLEGISAINQRNRNMMKETFLGGGVARATSFEETDRDDPFTRKSGKMRVVSGKAKVVKVETVTTEATPQSIEVVSKVESRPLAQPHTASSILASNRLPLSTGSNIELPSAKDLFSAHDVPIDIQLKMPVTLPSSSSNRAQSKQLQQQTSSAKPSGSRPLSLEEYKRKRGMI